ncbi:MAG: SRPBCC family protein [Deltaproteobacteria bacterium]|nr:SRPBCC family protein [Deltaproteobacteria bacterium]
MAEARKSIEINCPASHVYKVITDFGSHTEFVSGLKGIEVLEKKGEEYKVRYKVNMVKDIEYTLSLKGEKPHKLSWTLIKGDMMKENYGNWDLKETAKNKTLATYTLTLALSGFIPSSITTKLAEVSLPKMLEEYKKRAEETFGK